MRATQFSGLEKSPSHNQTKDQSLHQSWINYIKSVQLHYNYNYSVLKIANYNYNYNYS